MQRSQRGYKHNQRRKKPSHVRVSRAGKRSEAWHILTDTLNTSTGADPTMSMTPEQFENWRQKIKQDK